MTARKDYVATCRVGCIFLVGGNCCQFFVIRTLSQHAARWQKVAARNGEGDRAIEKVAVAIALDGDLCVAVLLVWNEEGMMLVGAYQLVWPCDSFGPTTVVHLQDLRLLKRNAYRRLNHSP